MNLLPVAGAFGATSVFTTYTHKLPYFSTSYSVLTLTLQSVDTLCPKTVHDRTYFYDR